MQPTNELQSTIPHLAELIQNDIYRRGLSPGDAYLTADEVSAFLAVHPRAASRAMNLLAQRGVLVRRRGVGTFVGPSVKSSASVSLGCVHILAGATLPRTSRRLGGLLAGLAQAGITGNVQWNFLPASDPVAQVRVLLERGTQDGSIAGLVLVHCPRQVQQQVLKSRLPAVVFGSVYPDCRGLASVDLEQTEVGRLMGRYILDRGLLPFTLLMRETWLPGDNALLDGLNRILAAEQVNHGALTLRSLPCDGILVADELRGLLGRSDRPKAIGCVDPLFAESATRVAAELNLRVPEDLTVVFSDYDSATSARPDLTHIHSELPYEEQALAVGQMLNDLIAGRPRQSLQVSLSVRLTAGRELPAESRPTP